MYYSSVNYFSLGEVLPREKLRQPRRRRGFPPLPVMAYNQIVVFIPGIYFPMLEGIDTSFQIIEGPNTKHFKLDGIDNTFYACAGIDTKHYLLGGDNEP